MGREWEVYEIDAGIWQDNSLVQGQIFAGSSLTGHLFYSENSGENWSVVDLGSNSATIATVTFGRVGDVLPGTLSEGVYRISKFQLAFPGSP